MDRERWEREVAAHYGQVLRGLIAVAGRRERAEDALHDALLAAPVGARADGTVTAPNAYIRADGTATFYLSPTGVTTGEWSGDLIDLVGRARAQVTTPGVPIATVLLDSKL